MEALILPGKSFLSGMDPAGCDSWTDYLQEVPHPERLAALSAFRAAQMLPRWFGVIHRKYRAPVHH